MLRSLRNAAGRVFRRPDRVDARTLAALWLIAIAIALVGLLFARDALALPLSPGDRVSLTVHEGEGFSGKYQVNLLGALEIPYVGQVSVAGMELHDAARAVAHALVGGRMFRPGAARVTLQILDWAPIEVLVEGAVYLPGLAQVNVPPPRDRAPERAEEAPGGRPSARFLSDALRAAGGIRIDADIGRVRLTRRGQTREVDLWAFIEGGAVDDPPLLAGDRIWVPSTGTEDARLARPSRLTPPGIKIFVSNLTQPATNNNASTMQNGALSLPYGSRLSQALVGANCAGGARTTNAGRKAVLIRTDRITAQAHRWETDIEEVFRNPTTQSNPLLIEGDSLACYDSTVTDIREVFRTIADIVSPWRLIVPR